MNRSTQPQRRVRLPGLLLAIALAAASPNAVAFDVQDHASLFSADAVRKANAGIKEIEQRSGVPITIEVVPSLAEILTAEEAGRKDKVKPIDMVNEVAKRRDRKAGNAGIYILVAKKEHVNSNVLVSEKLAGSFPAARRAAIRDELTRPFKEGKFDQGLNQAVAALDEFLPGKPGVNHEANPRAGKPGGGGFKMGTLLFFGFLIIAVLLVLRLIGAIFRGVFGMGRGGYGPRPGYGPGGYGPGYGPGGYGPGYGGGGGGFMSSIFGGLGGALFGNWMYDQFSGRHHQGGVPTSFPQENAPGIGGGIVGADDDNRGGDWGGDAGAGGDWGGGGGGDWGGSGGGGGDWGGGGGGDWGGGGGGDWGGGGGGGGEW
ncbi:MAG: TPM domain-containing protein [Isosphaeraceae bacterium]